MEFVILTYLSTVGDSLKGALGALDWAVWAVILVGVCLTGGGLLIRVIAPQDFGIDATDKFDPTLPSKSTMHIMYVRFSRLVAKALIASIMLSIAWTLVPRKSDVYVVMGGYVVAKAAESQAAQSIGSKSIAAIERWLAKQIADSQAENATDKNKTK